MAKSKPKKKPASKATVKAVKIDPKTWKKLALAVESLPEAEQAIAIGTTVMNREAGRRALAEFQEYKSGAEYWWAWAIRIRGELESDTQHKPVAAKYVGKALVVRTRVAPTTRDRICKPDIFGVFASPEASGVLKDDALYEVAVACANGKGRSTSSNPTSKKLTNPLKLLKKRGLVQLIDERVRLMDGCERVFDPIKWPPPVPRDTYVEPKPT
ncbi:MAG: hypothetical protein K8S94_01845 [Planctomycetia bacterium]|nr:hypothetical protein [Planctomycetia bacterium]